MATARERLMQLTLAQQESQQQARESARRALPTPRGGGVLQRPIRPSQAGQIDSEEGTPLLDFGEMFLNQLGITSTRQRRGAIEQLMAVDEANKSMLNAAAEQLSIVANRGVGGINADRFLQVQTQLENAAKLLDNPAPEIQEFGRAQIQSAANSLDAITEDQRQFLGQQRDRIQGRLDGLVDLGREEQRLNDDVIAVLNKRGESNGINSKLSQFEKQILASYLNGTSFSQQQREGGFFSSIPGFNTQFDPTEEISVGNASALVESVKKTRVLTLADQIARENQTATGSGLRLENRDGRLTVDEIIVPELGPEIEDARFVTPPGEPLNIQPGLPSEQDIQRQQESNVEQGTAIGETLIESFQRTANQPIFNPREVEAVQGAATNISDRFRRFLQGDSRQRETN